MKNAIVLILLLFSLFRAQGNSKEIDPSIKSILLKVEKMVLNSQNEEAIDLLLGEVKKTKSADALAIYYGQLSSIFLSKDSLQQGKKYHDLSVAQRSSALTPEALAATYRSSAYLKSFLNLSDEVVKEANEGLNILQQVPEAYSLKYALYYLLYSTYSGWNDSEKMEDNIRKCELNANLGKNYNQQSNVQIGYSSLYLARYRKHKKIADLDSSYHHLLQSYNINELHPDQVSGNTKVVTAVNLANYYLEFAEGPVLVRKKKAYGYLAKAEEELKNNNGQFGRWVNIYGIKSSFAQLEGNIPLAEQYLIAASTLLNDRKDNSLLKLEYKLYQELSSLSEKKNDLASALAYHKKAEMVLKQNFDQVQLFNTQKLDIQYETERKDQQLKLLEETAALQKKLNYVYGGAAVLAVLVLIFMLRSYKFKLQYAKSREIQLAKQKEAEQEIMELKHQQLQKEALANNLIIEHKNDMLKQIKTKIQEGDSSQLKKLLKEENLLSADFEDIKWQIQQLHPNFFQQLMDKSTQKLTQLDLKYCAYIYLQLSTKQIAQVLHVEPQSVRMFKYRLKQKFGLPKESDLENFLQELV